MSPKIFQLFKIIIIPHLIPSRRNVGGEQRGILLKEERKRWIFKSSDVASEYEFARLKPCPTNKNSLLVPRLSKWDLGGF